MDGHGGYSGGHPALWPVSPWAAEDGGPSRLQRVAGEPPSEGGVVWRDAPGASMVVLRDPGEVYLYRFAPGSEFGFVERIHPETLEPLEEAEPLPSGGVWWPGGVCCAADGFLYATVGRYCHKLRNDGEWVLSAELPRARPYNSHVITPDGHLVMKDIVLDGGEPSQVVVLEPRMLDIVAMTDLPEPCVARLSADGDDVYAVGTRTAFRYSWDGVELLRDETWSVPYVSSAEQSYGWDPVVAAGHVWWLDNGEHRYAGTMRGAGVAAGPVHLVRASVHNALDWKAVEVCGAAYGTVTNPPLVDPTRKLAVAFDSGNGLVCAVRDDEVVWRAELEHAAHMMLYPTAGVLVCEDWRSGGGDVVYLDVDSGRELRRVPVPSGVQSVVFWAPGWSGDMYYTSFAGIARIT